MGFEQPSIPPEAPDEEREPVSSRQIIDAARRTADQDEQDLIQDYSILEGMDKVGRIVGATGVASSLLHEVLKKLPAYSQIAVLPHINPEILQQTAMASYVAVGSGIIWEIASYGLKKSLTKKIEKSRRNSF